jgi:V8-like Glu-specific endopeptidase
MKKRRTRIPFAARSVAPLLAVLLEGCTEPPEEPIATDEAAVQTGVQSWNRPEVGQLYDASHGAMCTGTLVAPRVVLTAAHCLRYESNDWDIAAGSTRFYFRISWYNPASGRIEEPWLRGRRHVSLGTQVGPTDLGLVFLWDEVPASMATPAPIADARPNVGEWVTIFGYGCNWTNTGLVGWKQELAYGHSAWTTYNCPGDSGGPRFRVSTGQVWGVNSGFTCLDERCDPNQNTGDILGDPVAYRDSLYHYINGWSGTP